MRVAILTVSDAAARGERQDRSGDAIEAWVNARGYGAGGRATVPDRVPAIVAQLAAWCDAADRAADSGAAVVDLVLTTGGTGLSPRDVTPEATRSVIEREAPGLAERIRMVPMAIFPRAALSRGIAGVRGRTLIVNLPGSTNGVRDALVALEPIIDHAIAILRDEPTDHTPG